MSLPSQPFAWSLCFALSEWQLGTECVRALPSAGRPLTPSPPLLFDGSVGVCGCLCACVPACVAQFLHGRRRLEQRGERRVSLPSQPFA